MFRLKETSTARRSGTGITWLGIHANILLSLIKILAGVFGRSAVILADGIHSLSDLVSDFTTLIALRLGAKPEDEGHHYGHGKMQDLAALFLGLGLLYAALRIGVTAAVSIASPPESSPQVWLVAVALLSVIIKELLFRQTRRVATRDRSPALRANALHHRSDALSSLAAAVGVGAASISPDLAWADGAAALLVVLFVAKTGGEIAWSAGRDLVDTAPDRGTIDSIQARASSLPGVREIRRIRARTCSGFIALDLDVAVDANLTVREGHDIALLVEESLRESFDSLKSVTVHVDPWPQAHENGD